MENIVKIELYLHGLDCANCATKIEDEIKKIIGVNGVSVNFIFKKLTMEIDSKNSIKDIIEQAESIISKIEFNIKLSKYKIKNENGYMKSNISFILGIIVFIIALILPLNNFPEVSLYILAYILLGGKIVIKAVRNIIGGQLFDENFLMTIATFGAFAIQEYPEAVAVMLFYNIGERLQALSVNRSIKSISNLMDIRPDYANLLINNEIQKVSPQDVKIGAMIIVKPGEKIPLDGKILTGSSSLDTSALTGEIIPKDVGEGDEVLSGTINKNGILTIEVLKEYGDSTISKILDLIENASNRKAKTENFITKFAKIYTPIVVITALFIAIIPIIIFKGENAYLWINKALGFLVVSCPCALVISIPLSFFGGIGAASKNGILIKGSNYLEALNSVDTIIFDKTGTLTKGIFKVTKVVSHDVEYDILKYAAYAESLSNHPVALSIVNGYGKAIDKGEIENINEIPGLGLKAIISGENVLLGNDKFMQSENIAFLKCEEIGSIVHIAINNTYRGYIVISDQIKEDSKKTIYNLRNMGVNNLIMLTGDNKTVGESIGKELVLDKVYSDLLPHQKVEKLEYIINNKKTDGSVIFVGDGINDAPVLARADVGIAMGGIGSDSAIETADIILMNDEPYKIVTALKIAKKTRIIVWENIIFTLIIKILVLVLLVLGFSNIWQAVFADVGVSLIAILNSVRIIRVSNY